MISAVCLAALLVWTISPADETADIPDALVQRFERLDANDDGKLSVDEVPWEAWFKQTDADNDGFVTLREVQAAAARRQQARTERDTGERYGTTPEGVTKHTIAYRQIEVSDPERLSLDLYAPEGAQAAPIMLFVHGGGWAKGDRSAVWHKPEFFCTNGWLFASTNYRFVPDVTPADQVRDVAHAIAWLHAHAAEYGGDPDRIFIMGHSAGAHLAALVATDPEPLQEAGLDLNALTGTVVLDTGTLDLVAHMQRVKARGLFGAAFGTDPAFWDAVSPLARIQPDSDIPPFLIIIQGAQPRLDGADRFANALTQAGTQAEVVYLPNHDHGTVNRNVGKAGDPVTKAIVKFATALGAKLQDAKTP
ncbi:MAG: alpha/beta hydrolase fold domain-containing protein [Armatimonadota bacterium]